MGKNYLFLAAAAMAMTASAAVTGQAVVKGQNPMEQFRMQEKANVELFNVEAKTMSQKAPARATEIINVAPQGETKRYTRAGGAFYVSSGYLYEGEQEGMIEIVFGNDGKVYFKNLINYFATDTYVAGTLEGNNITVSMGQTIYTWASYGYGAEIHWGNVVRDEDGEVAGSSDVTIDYDTDAAVFVLDNEAGTITLQGSNENHILGAFYDDDQTWTGRGDYNNVYTVANIPEVIVPPTTEAYHHYGTYYGGELFADVNVSSTPSSTEVFFQGLTVTGDEESTILADAWVKGNKVNNIVTIPSGQYIGVYGSYLMYLVGADADGNITDIVMTYDEATDTYTLQTPYYVNAKQDEVYYLTYFTAGNIITKQEFTKPEVVEVPADLQLIPCVLDTYEMSYDDNDELVFDPIKLQLTLGIDAEGNKYLQGLCQDLPEAWVVVNDGDNNSLVIPGRQNFGIEYFYVWGSVYEYQHYLLGMNENGDLGVDIVLNYDDEAGVWFSNTDYIVDNGRLLSLYYYHIYTEPKIKQIEEKPAKPADPEIVAYTYYEDYGYARLDLNIPTVDVNGEDLVASKLYYRIYGDIERNIEQLYFDFDLYPYIDEEMDEVPYNYTDDEGAGYDIYKGGNPIYLNHENVGLFNKVGVQTVYYGGLEAGALKRAAAENESEIVWYEITPYTETAVNEVNASKTVSSVRYYNVAGQQSSKPFEGMNIVVSTYTDGTTSTSKVIK